MPATGATLSSLQLGRYQILKQLATGAVADVWLARATGLEGFARHVVIKRIRPELAQEERLVRAFLDEARIAASLHHQNVVQVHDIGEQDGAYYFAMEYVHGEDVRRLIQKARERGEQVPFEHLVSIISATAAGLHHAHEQRDPAGEPLGLVHRDIAPANILIGYDGSVKLVDFGMAKAGLRSAKTASGTLKGKSSYLSPEQCVGKPIDRRTDIFALGIVLYELATTRRLFKAASELLTMSAIVEGEIPTPSSLRREISPVLDAIILRALSRDPASRFQTAEDLREALERFAVGSELRTSAKALADYMIAMFGARPEPWEVLDEQPVLQAPDPTHGKGLVAPPVDAQAIARHAPRATSPIMLAQALADGDDIEEIATKVLRTPQEVPAAPAFVDEVATVVMPPAYVAATLAASAAAEPPAEIPVPEEPTPTPEAITPPPPTRSALRRFFATYGRSIAFGASAGFIVVALAALTVRSCAPHHEAPAHSRRQ